MKNEEAVYNPLSFDFVCSYDSGGENPQEYKVLSQEIAYFSSEVAKYVKKKLYTAIVNDRNLNGIALNADPKEKQKILDEMNV